ncbi:energy-coupling factor transporter transmembrane component T family protein [Tautonia plasticadhaerens]|uniref:Nickel transport protein NikQ n=1 Tax=Tautonia plasticadhaerens TaxID=2527974 RepID=A0A518GXK6_9BACT|nr:CbiQ family ECF transporter T component [Tautonia plasticadhaerens]QDV33315.1 Nickel transport protein NikQ [Tautonia plasticadhaerens]
MRLDRLEPDGSGAGPLHRLDARVTLTAALFFVVAVVATPFGAWRPLGVSGMLLAFLVGISGIPAGALLRRGLALLPVVLMLAAIVAPSHPEAAELGPWRVGLTIVAKNGLTILAVLLLAHVTAFRRILAALAWFRVPTALVATLHLMYRYLFVLADQLGRMARARRSRSFRGARRDAWPLNAGLIAALMLRSFERGERVHSAMLARGWDGTIRSLDGPDSPEPPSPT